MGLGICIFGVAILFGIIFHSEGRSERIYAYYCPPAFILFIVGHLLTNKK
jgi:hypothetical protein